MGLGKWIKKQSDSYQESDYLFRIGCQVMGQPRGQRGQGSPLERLERIEAGRKEVARRIAEAPRPSRDDGYASQMRSPGEDATIEYFIGKDGNPTTERPHVHVIHQMDEGKIIFKVTQADGRHTHTQEMPINAFGNDVNNVQNRMIRMLE